jgi:hypothetical protein
MRLIFSLFSKRLPLRALLRTPATPSISIRTTEITLEIRGRT